MDELTVVCWKWKSTNWRPSGYGAKHVNALSKMLKEYLHLPYRLVCVTDDPKGVKCETYPLWEEPKIKVDSHSPNCYKRLKLFSSEAKQMFGEWVLSIDLDVLIRDDITDLFDFKDEFKIKQGFSSPYNGSMWLLKTGTRTQVWDEFDPVRSPKEARAMRMPNGKRYYGSDQAWISYKIPNEPIWTLDDGVTHFSRDIRKNGVQDYMRMIFFPGQINPWSGEMASDHPEIFEDYKRWLK